MSGLFSRFRRGRQSAPVMLFADPLEGLWLGKLIAAHRGGRCGGGGKGPAGNGGEKEAAARCPGSPSSAAGVIAGAASTPAVGIAPSACGALLEPVQDNAGASACGEGATRGATAAADPAGAPAPAVGTPAAGIAAFGLGLVDVGSAMLDRELYWRILDLLEAGLTVAAVADLVRVEPGTVCDVMTYYRGSKKEGGRA